MTSNDPLLKKINLNVKAEVLPFADIKPAKAQLWGKVSEEVKEEIIIKPRKNNTFKIIDKTAANNTDIKFEVKQEKDHYRLIVTNIRKEPGVYSDVIFLRTDNKKKSVIRVNVYGNIK